MSIVEDVSAQMKVALKAGEPIRLRALRNMRTAFLNEMKKDGSETLSDEACLGLLRKLAKQRHESIDAFEQAGRSELAVDERTELEVIETYLPSLADEATVRGWVEEAISQTGASAVGDVGRVMGALMKAHKGEMDGGLAKRIASELLKD